MTVGEKIRLLKESDEYLIDRSKTPDEFIEMVKVMMPDDYKEIEDKEKYYQYTINNFLNINKP